MAAHTNFVALSVVFFLTFSLCLVAQARNRHRPSLDFQKNQEDGPNYLVGVGRADVTGPAAEVNMMGYANPAQQSSGIHFRQFSRAFIVSDPQNTTRTVFVSVDCAMVSQILKIEVVKKLKPLFGNAYNESNVCLSAIHTHSGPAGFLQYVLFDVTSLGFVRESFNALVDGIVASIQRAHNNVVPGDLYLNQGELQDANINRSPTAYLNNPESERAKYDANTDKNMVVLKFVDQHGTGLGMISWFAVHCTSMNNTNGLISGDNKGYASQLFEADMNPGSLAGQGSFVAAFAQSNEGDVSPNTRGPHCQDTGLACDLETSTCNGKSELCVSPGPGVDMFDSTRIIGHKQYSKAKELYNADAQEKLSGPVQFALQFVDMSDVTVQINSSYSAKTCKPAMGYSFAAGTTDGPGAFDFTQGDTEGNPFWNFVRNIIKQPSAEEVACQAPKPILLPTGEMTFPYAWQPDIVDIQLLRWGQLVVAAVPGEFSTMSGRRLRDSIQRAVVSKGLPEDTEVVVAGLSNTYSDYITTYEEYQVQRYEGASTIYGPHTLAAYQQLYSQLAQDMVMGADIDIGPSPPNLLSRQLSFLPPVVLDTTPLFTHFGEVITDAGSAYHTNETVSVRFHSAHPRNNLQLDGSFLTVERKKDDGTFEVVHNDASWDTMYKWKRTNVLVGHSEATITWTISPGTPPGTYRIRHFGHSKNLVGEITPFVGSSRHFTVNH
ncbi:PREDICTED: neutral ceramidase-like isoform X2 [Branchiostoma belcheri]|uniref:Neutral ceramidase n=1 Tax=Branchiostoma belcheri TaxID=7741 RepID=A0A6P4Y718_BRABE|nr:PREDICTED: neutral ceramidase-like isoform X2 [Branchiostoma belcheri]